MIPPRDKKALIASNKGVEIWKDIPGYRDHYQVSNLGNVRSKDRFVETPYKDTFRNRYYKSKLMTLSSHKATGYRVVALSKKGKDKQYKVHVLVMRTFCGKRPKDYDTRHLNGTKYDNKLHNLMYGTKKKNSADRVLHGTHNRGEKNYSVVLTEKEVIFIRSKKNTISNNKKLALKFNVTYTTITYIQDRKTWRHLQ
jgi:hypothetical protein